MNYVGKWVFHSIGAMNENDEMVYLNAEDYLNAPMPYIDESDEEAVAGEMRERTRMIGMQVRVCEDGRLYMLMPLPEGVSQAEIDRAVASGAITLMDGMMADPPMAWEERDGELWYDTRISGEVDREQADSWKKAIIENGLFTFFTIRFAKAEEENT